MLSLKSILTKSTPAPPSAPAAEALAKGRQLHAGRTGARVETLTAEVDAAKIALTQAKNAEGECWVDGRDATTAAEARRHAENRLHGLESALSVAKEKHEAAIAARKQSETEFKRETLRVLLTELGSVARKAEMKMRETGQLAGEATRIIRKIDAFGLSELNSRLKSWMGWFRIMLLDHCEDMPGCLTGADL